MTICTSSPVAGSYVSLTSLFTTSSEHMALLKEASEMFDETGCVPGIDGEQVSAERIRLKTAGR
jgi:hypothetical protein